MVGGGGACSFLIRPERLPMNVSKGEGNRAKGGGGGLRMRVGGARRREGHGGVTRWWRHTHTAPSRPSPRSPTPHVWLCAFAQRGGGRTEQQGRWAPPTPAHAVSSAGVGVWVWHARTRARGHHSCLEASAACVVKKGGRAAVAAGEPFFFPSPLQLLCSTVPHHTAKHPRKLLWGGWPVGWGLWWRSGKRSGEDGRPAWGQPPQGED